MARLAALLRVALALTPLAAGCMDPTGSISPSGSTPTASLGYDALVALAIPIDSITVDVSGLPSDDPSDPRQTVGIAVPVGVAVDLSALRPADLGRQPRAFARGAIRADGSGFVWSATVEAPGAAALRLELTDLFLPRNAELYAFDDLGNFVGPFTRLGPEQTGELWTEVLRGERVTLLVRYTGTDLARALGATRFTLETAGVLDQRFELARYLFTDPLDRAFCSFNASCVQNASCSTVPAAIQPARDAIAQLLFKSGGFFYICSGGLVADTDPGSAIPYLLTAHHCISRAKEATSLQTFFHFSTACGGSCASPSVASTTGSSIQATNATGDYTLLRLASAPPSGTSFLPYSTTAVATVNGTNLHRISHPGGAPQAYSTHRVDTSAGTCSGWPRGSWIYSRDTYGATEGGSSGSPVLNASGQIVGQLSGGCGTNVNDNCDAVNNATVDGAFASYYPEVAPLLNPAGSCTDADGDGFCVSEGDCNDANAAVNPDATESCSNGIDDDCDGQTDAADGDCSTCELLPVGATCTRDSQCCSDNCRRTGGRKTCR